MALNTDTKDFLLHLYDKLWENMGAKEGRLWNYLSIYGAAVALALGAGGYGGIELQAAMLVLLLTTWAVLIVINANWWYQRNRLMVTQIEKQFAKDGGLDGVVPKKYRDANFQMDRLYRGSAAILCVLALLLYLRAMWLYDSASAVQDQATLYSLVALYVISVLGIMYCTAHHESYITSFYRTKKDLLLEGSPSENIDDLPAREREARLSYGWRKHSVVALIFTMAVFDAMPVRAALPSTSRLAWGTVLQLICVSVFYLILRMPYDSAHRKSLLWERLSVFLLLLGSAAVLLS